MFDTMAAAAMRKLQAFLPTADYPHLDDHFKAFWLMMTYAEREEFKEFWYSLPEGMKAEFKEYWLKLDASERSEFQKLWLLQTEKAKAKIEAMFKRR